MHRDLIVRTLVPLCLALATLGSPVAADETGDQVFDLRFAGGTVDQYVAAIRKQADMANIIVMLDAGRARVPAVELRGVSVATALSILHDTNQQTAEEYIELAIEEHEPRPRRPESPGMPMRAGIGAPAYSVLARVRNLGRHAAAAPDMTRVLAVSELLDDLKAEALLTAIETALELIDEDMPPARIRFHEDTGLIIARGQREQIASIEEVVDQVKQGVRQRSGARDRSALEHEVRQLRDEMQEARHQLEAFRREAEEQLRRVEREKDELHHVIRSLELELARQRDSGDDRE